MIYLKINILESLKKAGYNTYRIKVESLFGAKTVQDFRNGVVPGIKTINTLCRLLNCQPSDIIGYKPDEE